MVRIRGVVIRQGMRWGVSERRTEDATLIEALRILSRAIKTEDGVIPACLAEAATRLETLVEERRIVIVHLERQKANLDRIWALLPPGPEVPNG